MIHSGFNIILIKLHPLPFFLSIRNSISNGFTGVTFIGKCFCFFITLSFKKVGRSWVLDMDTSKRNPNCKIYNLHVKNTQISLPCIYIHTCIHTHRSAFCQGYWLYRASSQIQMKCIIKCVFIFIHADSFFFWTQLTNTTVLVSLQNFCFLSLPLPQINNKEALYLDAGMF